MAATRECSRPAQPAPSEASRPRFDVDGSGRITHTELRGGMVKMGFCCAEAEARAMVDQLDLARGKKGGADGELDFKEFVRGVLNADSLLRTRLYPS